MKQLATTANTYSQIEATLRQALAAGRPMTLGELIANPDVARVAKGIQQVRDCVATLRRADKVRQTPVDGKENKGYKVAFIWSEGAEPFTLGSKAIKRAEKAPSKPLTTNYAAPNPNEVELVLNGIEIIAGVNPVTGRIRIQIESPK